MWIVIAVAMGYMAFLAIKLLRQFLKNRRIDKNPCETVGVVLDIDMFGGRRGRRYVAEIQYMVKDTQYAFRDTISATEISEYSKGVAVPLVYSLNNPRNVRARCTTVFPAMLFRSFCSYLFCSLLPWPCSTNLYGVWPAIA